MCENSSFLIVSSSVSEPLVFISFDRYRKTAAASARAATVSATVPR